MAAKLDVIEGQPGAYAFLCTCGHRRTVVDSERFFRCERPVGPKEKACEVTHELSALKDEMTERFKLRNARQFLADSEAKLAEAREIVAAADAKKIVKPAKKGV